MEGVIKVAIRTDGLGTYQACCMDCPWKGPWRRSEKKAVEDARQHTTHQEGTK